MTQTRRALALTCLAIATVVACGAASAATTRASKAPASAAAPAPQRTYATRAQLNDCMDDEDALKVKRAALEKAQAEHEAHVNDLEAENAKIVEVQGQLDHDSDTAVQAFNLLVADHNAHVKQVNAEMLQGRADADVYNQGTLALNRKCAALVYHVDDMAAVMKERRAAGKSTTQ